MLEQSISCYCFDRLLSAGDIKLTAVMQFVRSIGFQSIEFLDMYWPKDQPRQEAALAIREMAQGTALGISCYTVHNDLGLFDETAHAALVERMLDDIELAVALGAPVMRVEATWGPEKPQEDDWRRYLEPVARGLKTVAARAAERGVAVGVENHGRFVGYAERIEELITAVDDPNFGACIDIGNFLVVDEDPLDAVRRLAPHARHVHVKDMHLFEEPPAGQSFATNAGMHLCGAILGEGTVDVDACVEAIVRAGYSGALSLEYEGMENVFYAVGRAWENLSDVIRRLPPV